MLLKRRDMKRNEVEALLAIEGLKIQITPVIWGKRYKKIKKASATRDNGRYEYWEAKIGFITEVENDPRIAVITHKGTFFSMCSSTGLTNHEAASNAYKQHKKYSVL